MENEETGKWDVLEAVLLCVFSALSSSPAGKLSLTKE